MLAADQSVQQIVNQYEEKMPTRAPSYPSIQSYQSRTYHLQRIKRLEYAANFPNI